MATQSEGFLRAYSAPSAGDARHSVDTQDRAWSFSSGVKQQVQVSISGGAFTALTIPASALGVAIVLPAAAGNNLIWKGVSGDTGFRVDQQMPLLSSLNQGDSMGFQNTGPTIVLDAYFF